MVRLCKRVTLIGTAAAVAVATGATAALAGGFAIREQSAESQGASFAGNGAGTGLGAMYWNPAAAANKSGPGINTEIKLQLDHPASEHHGRIRFPRRGAFVRRAELQRYREPGAGPGQLRQLPIEPVAVPRHEPDLGLRAQHRTRHRQLRWRGARSPLVAVHHRCSSDACLRRRAGRDSRRRRAGELRQGHIQVRHRRTVRAEHVIHGRRLRFRRYRRRDADARRRYADRPWLALGVDARPRRHVQSSGGAGATVPSARTTAPPSM